MDNMISNCHKCKYEITAECVPRSQKMSYPKCFVSIITNADRIRAMSDEELAEKFAGACPDGYCCSARCREYYYKGGCKNCWLDWLKATKEIDNG